MRDDDAPQYRPPINRRQMLGGIVSGLVASTWKAPAETLSSSGGKPLRAINVMNFIRAEEPREAMDLMLPLREQMRSLQKHDLPASWMLQYDALTEGSFVEFLKTEMPASHEVGIWFEMNRRLCNDAGVRWRGRQDWEWDYHVPVAYSIGYPPEERRRLIDTAMAKFERVFGQRAKSVASWNLDAVTAAHLSDRYSVDALGNCRDQLATDGFTIWGAPIARTIRAAKTRGARRWIRGTRSVRRCFGCLDRIRFITTTRAFLIQTPWSRCGLRDDLACSSIASCR